MSTFFAKSQFPGIGLRDYMYSWSFRQVLDVLKSLKKQISPLSHWGNCLYGDGVPGFSPAVVKWLIDYLAIVSRYFQIWRVTGLDMPGHSSAG
jgi:hypothetical protein